jgi:hypothetical protein
VTSMDMLVVIYLDSSRIGALVDVIVVVMYRARRLRQVSILGRPL